jgi:hypothetical protein
MADAKFCGHCGTRVARTGESVAPALPGVQAAGPSPAAPQATETSTSKVNLVQVFVGPKYEVYRQKWHSMAQRKSKQSWNWAAFFLNVYWLAYRKMYLMSAILLTMHVAWMAFGEYMQWSAWKIVLYSFFIPVWLGVYGNDFYLQHLKLKLKRLTQTAPASEWTRQAAAAGGTSRWAVLLAVALFIALAFTANWMLELFQTPQGTRVIH